MSARKSKKPNSRRVGTVADEAGTVAERPNGKSFLRRYGVAIGTVTGLALAAIPIWPTFHSAYLAEDANRAAQNAELSIVRVDVTSTVELTEETRSPSNTDEVTGTGKFNAAAAKIILHNKGEQAELVKEVRVAVSKARRPEGCHGAGGAITSVRYDFVLPGDIDRRTFPLQLPPKKIDFEVAGQANDRLAVTIGEEYMGEAGWPWLISASVELVTTDNRTLKTDEFTLMDFDAVDRVIGVVNRGLRQGANPAECVQRNIGVLEEAIEAPGDHSKSIDTLLARLKEMGFTRDSAPGTSSADAPNSVPPVPPGTGKWVAQLGSYPESAVTEGQLNDVVATLEQKVGARISRLRSSDYGSLNPGYWFVFYDGEDFKDGHEALAFCSNRGMSDENLCVGRYVSRSQSDSKLICRPADPQGSPSCVRP
ncbi:hypothetical protein FHS29_003599 [Saccharothrix tamanrassetensis]|uniref:Uncharacterized protein n=1 Tax=Saccharothrix tamanrassetensis TaxID=1051531 RepID=A0A841CN87_9PSEU|nr:hypothetical protein [Saccharothrix tamanrassetensis]MBB5957006.1 hypothetical protein [Saccharothrix tamanrassetensis]